MKQNIYGMTPARLEKYFTENGENPAKAAIVFDGIYRRRISSFDELGLSQRVRGALARDFEISLPVTVEALESADTAKLLLRLGDGEFIETVLMRQKFGACVCVSTQVGCSMGCAFCRSGQMKKRRNLSPAEIVGQIAAVEKQFGVRVSGVSVMGIGEPFDNFENVKIFLDNVTHPEGLNIGWRHISLSTCGVVPKIYELADMGKQLNLCISLHASNDAVRDEIMPINHKYKIAELLDAVRYYI